MSAQSSEQRADRLAIADDDPVDAADLTGLGADAEATGRTDQRQRRLGAGAADLESRRAAGLGERAVREERTAPRRHRVARRAGDDLRRKTADRAAAAVDEARLAGQRLAVLGDP